MSMNNESIGKLNIFALILIIATLLAGCASGNVSDKKIPSAPEYGVYYLAQDESQTVFEKGHGLSEASGISDYILSLQEDPSDVKLKRTVGNEIGLIDYRKDETGAVLNFEEKYYDMSANKEVLFRAATAQTVLQDKNVKYVIFEINGSPLLYKNGEEVGSMTETTFIDNAGDELSSYVKKKVRLYFANSDGTSLLKVEREQVYSINEPLEKMVIEQLIEGPKDGEGYATISPDTRLNTVVLKDGTCYASFDAALVDKPVDVNEETLLYSIVNSLCSLPGVNKVQISINGETDRTLRSAVRLDEAYSFNEEMVSSD